MSIAQAGLCQQNNPPQVPREAQEVISAAAETIRQDKVTIESRSERIRMYKSQLEAVQQALDLALENDQLSEEMRENLQAEIADLRDQISFLNSELEMAKKREKKEKRRKIFWKCTTAVATATTVYFLLL